MNRSLSIRRSGLAIRALLLLALVGSVGGIGLHAIGRVQSTRVTELKGMIGTKFYSGPIVFSPDGKALALLTFYNQGETEVWNLETKTVRLLASDFSRGAGRANHAAFTKDGRLLAVDYQNQGVAIWDLAAKKELVRIAIAQPRWVSDMAFADGDKTLVAIVSRGAEIDRPGPSLWNQSIVRWEVATGKELATHVLDPAIQFKVLSPDGRHAVFENNAGQTVFDLATGKKAFSIAMKGNCLFSDDGSTLVSYNGDEVIVLDVPSGKETKRFRFPLLNKNYSPCLALSPDKKLLAIGRLNEPHLVGLLSLESGKPLDTFACAPPSMICNAVRFSPDGRMLATDTYGGNTKDRAVHPLLKFWKLPTP